MRLIARVARKPQWGINSCWGIRYASSVSSLPAELAPYSPASKLLRNHGPARTRFAPSPTGYLHMGSLRTALFNYMVAKATGGQLILRVEDTDQTRTVKDAEERLYRDLEWAGIEWDEGPDIGGPSGPYKQSERTILYREHAERLLHSGHAYRCFCTAETLKAKAEQQAIHKLAQGYDRTCAHIPKEESDDRAARGDAHVVRHLSPDKQAIFTDLVYGPIRSPGKGTKKPLGLAFDDPILLKTDGFPTYHLANVVDDHLMKISHVIRGSEWLSSTPSHVALYQAFGWVPPQFAHVSLLVDEERQKLSKRAQSVNLTWLREIKGVFPESLTNFVALLGWSHNRKSDVMSMEDLIHNASLKFTKGDTVVSLDKLWFLQRRHAARYATMQPPKPPTQFHDLEEIAVKPMLAALNHHLVFNPEDFELYALIPETDRFNYVREIVWADAQNYTSFDDFITRHTYFFNTPSEESLTRSSIPPRLAGLPNGVGHMAVDRSALQLLFESLCEIEKKDWTDETLKQRLDSIVDRGTSDTINKMQSSPTWSDDFTPQVRKSWDKLIHEYIRWALMAWMPGPSGVKTMRILGREECLRRFDRAANSAPVTVTPLHKESEEVPVFRKIVT